jgi:hypothetical protein
VSQAKSRFNDHPIAIGDRRVISYASANASWIIKGRDGELVQAASSARTKPIFLNPGLDACLANNRR